MDGRRRLAEPVISPAVLLDWIALTRDGVRLKPAPLFLVTKPDEVFASLPYRGPPKSLKDMEAGIVAQARRRHARDGN